MTGQPDHPDIFESPLPLFRCKFGVVHDRIPYLGVSEAVFPPECLGVHVALGNTLLDQETLDAGDPLLRKFLIIFGRASHIGAATENQVGLRFVLQVLFKVGRERDQCPLLAG